MRAEDREGGEREREGELCVDGRGDGSVGKLSSVFQARVELRSPGPVLVPCGAHSDPLTWEGEGETAAWKLRSANRPVWDRVWNKGRRQGPQGGSVGRHLPHRPDGQSWTLGTL